jgi:predicted amidohydrolase
MPTVKIAGVQMDIVFADRQKNLDAMRERLDETVAAGADLTVFPECTTTGYCFESKSEAMAVAESMDGDAVQTVSRWCRQFSTRVIFGLLESENEKLFNSVALVGPQGLISRYRKVHLPTLGVDQFTTPGDGFAVDDLGDLRVGMNICYDCSFPESARVLTLQGADLIALPTNWPPGSGLTSELIPNARALENHVYFMAVNRVGTERGFDFIGNSRICDPKGNTLALADHPNEEILYADIDPEIARNKHLVSVPGKHEVHRIDDRQPSSYQSIVRPKK